MARKKRGGQEGLGGMAIGVIWLLVIIGILLAVAQKTGVTTMDGAFDVVRTKTAHYVECIPSGECGLVAILRDIKVPGDKVGSNIPSDNDIKVDKPSPESPDGVDYEVLAVDKETKGYRGPSKGEPYVNKAGLVNKSSSLTMLEEIEIITDKEDKDKDIEYSRAEWKHWSGTEGRPCWNTREEILNRDATPGTIVYVDKKMNATTDYNEACAIGRPTTVDDKKRIDTENSGEWIDPYSGKNIKNAGDIDIDHIIPLSNAARNGGQAWTPEQKEAFANDPDNLLATSAKENRSKGDKGPGKYMPPYKAYRCQYAKSYTTLSHKYKLTITDSDYKVLKETLESCQY